MVYAPTASIKNICSPILSSRLGPLQPAAFLINTITWYLNKFSINITYMDLLWKFINIWKYWHLHFQNFSLLCY